MIAVQILTVIFGSVALRTSAWRNVFDDNNYEFSLIEEVETQKNKEKGGTIRQEEALKHMKRRQGAQEQLSELVVQSVEGEHVDVFSGGHVDVTMNRHLDDSELRCDARFKNELSSSHLAYAERVGAKKIRCKFNAIAEGSDIFNQHFRHLLGPEGVLLQVHNAKSVEINYGSLLAASFDRRPYFAASEGELLVRTSVGGTACPRRPGAVYLSAYINRKDDQEEELLKTKVGLCERSVHIVKFDNLSDSLDVPVTVQLTDGHGKVLAKRQTKLTRVPYSRRSSSAVDFKHRALLVDGRPFFPISWFSSYLSFGLDKTLESLRDMAREGANSVMLYNIVESHPPRFAPRSTPVATRVLDYAATIGIKVHIYLVDIVDPLANGTSKDYAQLDRVLHALREHPAVLSWYVTDDSSGPYLSNVYRHIKELDPYHVVSAALLSADHITNYLDSADVYMIENYEQNPGHAFTKMAPLSQGTLEFLPAIHCGRAWADLEDEASWSPQMFRNQFYNAILAGATGEVWFAYRNADGWNEPGIPIRDAAGSVSRELLDLVPSLLSSNGFVRGSSSLSESGSLAVVARDQNGATTEGERTVRARMFQEDSGCMNLIIVNALNQPMQAEVAFDRTPEISFLKSGSELFTVPFEKDGGEPRQVRVRNFTLKEWLPSLGVQVFRHSCDEGAMSHDDVSNLIQNPGFETSHAYVAAPDSWDCRMAPMQVGESDSTCFADTHVAYSGRHAGRFATGLNTYVFRVRPTLKEKEPTVGRYGGSVWAQADVPMTLLALRLDKKKTIDGLAYDDPLVQETELNRLELTAAWARLDFKIDLCSGCSLAFKVTHPGTFWLDEARLTYQSPSPNESSVAFAEWHPERN